MDWCSLYVVMALHKMHAKDLKDILRMRENMKKL